MNKQIDFFNVGGFRLETDTVLDFMQKSYTDALAAIAKLCGDKVILTGMVEAAGNVSAGWISYNGELVFFTGGPLDTRVVITTIAGDMTFGDDSINSVYTTKVAACASVGGFAYDALVRLDTLIETKQNLIQLATDFAAHTHTWASITSKPLGYITYVGYYNIGNPATDSQYTITIPNQGDTSYKVVGQLVAQSSNPITDMNTRVLLVGGSKTTTTFKIQVREDSAGSQNLGYEFMIIKTL